MKKYGTAMLTALMAAGTIGFWGWSNGLLMPEVNHTAADIAAAYRYSGMVRTLSFVLLAAGVGITIWAWRQYGDKAFRAISVLPVVGLLAGAWLSTNTVVELLMFAPVEEARFVAVADATFLEPDHLVLGVAIGDESKAYPIGMLAYHHIVNDRLAGEPYVATY